MVATRPTKVPEWNTGGSNRTEPTAGEKTSGWALNDQPPSSYFNWLQYYTGAGIEWLYERMNDGSGPEDFTIAALQPNTTGNGGDLLLQAGPARTTGSGGNATLEGSDGAGTDQDGGGVNLSSGESTGTGNTVFELDLAEPETGGAGSGSYLNAPTNYIRARGDFKNIVMNKYVNFASTGPTDNGLCRFTQKTQPATIGPQGDFYFDDATKQARLNDNTGYRSFNTPFGTPFLSSFAATDAAAEVAFTTTGPTNILYTIPANYLSTGSRIRIWLGISRLGTPVDQPGFNIRMGPIGSHAVPPTGTILGGVAPTTPSATLDTFTIQAEIYVVAAGSPGTIESLTHFFGAPSSLTWQNSSEHSDNTQVLTINTAVANELFPTVVWNAVGAGTQNATLRYFSIEVL